jgi:hypothetical protein
MWSGFRDTRVDGAVYLKEGTDLIPLRNETLQITHLVQGPLYDFQSKRFGAFQISRPLKDGLYKICIVSEVYEGCNSFHIKGYFAKDIRVIVKKRNNNS